MSNTTPSECRPVGKLDGRAAIVTGASQGLGKEIVAAYLREGASVVMCARDGAMLAQTRAELSALATPGRQLLARTCDVSKPEQVDALVAAAIAACPELDILVNSAGIYGPMGPIEDNDWAAWTQAI